MDQTCWDWQPAQPSLVQQQAALLRLEGADALRFLHGQSSQAIEAAAPGSVLATCLISPTARMRALAQVLVDASGAWLLIEAGDGEAVRTTLDRVLFPADRVTLGPLQPASLVTPVPSEPETAGCAGPWQPLEEGLWQLPGQWLLLGEAALAGSLHQRPLLNPTDQERWRLQQGIPSAPGELNNDTNPFELGLAPRVSLNKGCYVGQETLAKLATYDGVKRQLRRWCALRGAGEPPLQPGQGLRSATGERAGAISSALALPQADGQVLWLGLALVRRSALDQHSLWCGEGAAAAELALSRPAGFIDPPVGTAQR
ncbi:MAG: folate-binding protein [Cyanobacteria bacterium K_DeepCast_35m_m2_023]|nr:folate-binding protein [Cyanobacteria bacterium K_DeepCast_35m_m2_023]